MRKRDKGGREREREREFINDLIVKISFHFSLIIKTLFEFCWFIQKCTKKTKKQKKQKKTKEYR